MTTMKKLLKPTITKSPKPWYGKVHQADKYWAKQLEKGYGQHTHMQQLIDERLESLMHPSVLNPPYSSGGDTDNEPSQSVLEPQSALTDDPSP